ncbi:MAG TPA: hypothetical protein VL503_06870 [Candidatus Omnitrophota bacterium]|nr:hypothetical protein [Candidatus Omnitrophota bacterium]
MRRIALAATALFAALAAHPALSAPPRVLEPLSFLLGAWEAPGPNQSSGRTVFALNLQDQVILRHNSADYPAAEDKPATRHEDLMVIYPVGNVLRADYYDSEGHAIRYVVLPAGAGRVLFLSDLIEKEPRYRLTYVLQPDGTLAGAFEVAPPGQPDAFKSYLTWQAHKAAPASGSGR